MERYAERRSWGELGDLKLGSAKERRRGGAGCRALFVPSAQTFLAWLTGIDTLENVNPLALMRSGTGVVVLGKVFRRLQGRCRCRRERSGSSAYTRVVTTKKGCRNR